MVTAQSDLPVIDGRPVYTRADIIARRGLGLSTLEALARAAAKTGHPAPVGKVGKALAWDAEAWDAWWRDYTSTEGLLDFAGVGRRYGVAAVTAAAWWRDRAETGHPDLVKKIGNTLYFAEADFAHWDPPRAGGGSGNRAGHPDDEITLAEAERVCGVAKGAFSNYGKGRRPPEGWPAPVRTEPLPSGRERELYRRSDIWRYDDERGRHGGGRPRGPKAARRYPYDGDPRLNVARRALRDTPAEDHPELPRILAGEHGGAPGTWGSILATARKHPDGAEATD